MSSVMQVRIRNASCTKVGTMDAVQLKVDACKHFMPKAAPARTKPQDATKITLHIITHEVDFELDKFRAFHTKNSAGSAAGATTGDDWWIEHATMPGETGYMVSGTLQATLHQWQYGKLRLKLLTSLPLLENPEMKYAAVVVKAVQELPDASMVLHLLGVKRLPVERYMEIGAPANASVSTSVAEAPTCSKQTKSKPPPSSPCSPTKTRRLAVAAGPSSPSPHRQLPQTSSSINLAGASHPLVQQSAAKETGRDCPGTSAAAAVGVEAAAVGVEAAATAVRSSVSDVFGAVGFYHNPRVFKALQLAHHSSTGGHLLDTTTKIAKSLPVTTAHHHGADLGPTSAVMAAPEGDAMKNKNAGDDDEADTEAAATDGAKKDVKHSTCTHLVQKHLHIGKAGC